MKSDLSSALLVNDTKEEESPPPPKPTSERLVSLDVLRGITILTMILVNNAGGAYPAIDHVPWDGLRLADFVMPFFLFMVGASIGLVTERMKRTETKRAIFKKVFVRTLKLFFIGMAIQNPLPRYNLATVRIMGILQRIALSYFVVATAATLLPVRMRKGYFSVFFSHIWVWVTGFAVCLIYLLITVAVPVPGCGFAKLTPACNAAGYVDSLILTPAHMYKYPTCREAVPPCKHFDPEGFTASISASLSAFIGAYFGFVLAHFKSHKERLLQWIPLSVVMTVLGVILHFAGIPFNKNLYSISYVLVMAGCAGLMLAAFYICIDVVNNKWVKMCFLPLFATGMNSIVVFIGDSIWWLVIGQPTNANCTRCFFYYSVNDGPAVTLGHWLYANLIRSWMDSKSAVLTWAFVDAFWWMLVAFILYKRKIFIKI